MNGTPIHPGMRQQIPQQQGLGASPQPDQGLGGELPFYSKSVPLEAYKANMTGAANHRMAQAQAQAHMEGAAAGKAEAEARMFDSINNANNNPNIVDAPVPMQGDQAPVDTNAEQAAEIVIYNADNSDDGLPDIAVLDRMVADGNLSKEGKFEAMNIIAATMRERRKYIKQADQQGLNPQQGYQYDECTSVR